MHVIATNNNFNLSSALLAYSDSLRARAAAAAGKTGESETASSSAGTTPSTQNPTQADATKGTSASGTSASGTKAPAKTPTKTEAALQAAIDNTPASFKTTRARADLDKTQQDLAKSLREAVAKLGGAIKGDVAFSLDSTGNLKITGSDADKAAISAALKADKSSPSLASRLASLTKNAVTLESNNRSSAVISQAARFAKTPAAVMSLYTTLMQQQQNTSTTAVFTLSDKSSSLAYKGMIDTSA